MEKYSQLDKNFEKISTSTSTSVYVPQYKHKNVTKDINQFDNFDEFWHSDSYEKDFITPIIWTVMAILEEMGYINVTSYVEGLDYDTGIDFIRFMDPNTQQQYEWCKYLDEEALEIWKDGPETAVDAFVTDILENAEPVNSEK